MPDDSKIKAFTHSECVKPSGSRASSPHFSAWLCGFPSVWASRFLCGMGVCYDSAVFLSGFPRLFASSVRSCRGFCSWIRFSCLLGPPGWILPELLKSRRSSCGSPALYSEMCKRILRPPVRGSGPFFRNPGGYARLSISLVFELKEKAQLFASPFRCCLQSMDCFAFA